MAVAPVYADDFDDALDAYNREDYRRRLKNLSR